MSRLLACSLSAAVMAGAACGGGTVVDRHDAAGAAGTGGVGRGGAGGAIGGTGGGTGGIGGAGGSTPKRIEQSLSRDVDILFMIDNSSEMYPAQARLRAALPSFVNSLQAQPGGMPGLHVGVVSSDMGAGDGSISGCAAAPPGGYSGDNGIFHYTGGFIPPATTTPCATHLQAGATYVSNVGGVPNYTGPLEDVLGCLTALGEAGCGFEAPFAAIARALGVDGLGPPPFESRGFVRPEAALAVILLTNEDDCSPSPGVPLFDTTANMTLQSQLGPSSNFRCNEFGHMCARAGQAPAHPSRFAPNNDVTAMVTYDSCTSNDLEGYELSAKELARQLQTLKLDPSRVVVASIQGPASPYVVHWKPPRIADTSCAGGACPWPEITHACTAADGSWADPGVRTQTMAQQFGSNGLVSSICADSYAPALQQVAAAIGRLFAPACLRSGLLVDPAKPAFQPDCAVTGHIPQADGTTKDQPVPSCADSAGVGPCWTATRQDATCNGGVAFLYTPGPVAPDPISSMTIQCTECMTDSNQGECF